MDVYASYANQQRPGTGQGTSQVSIPSMYQSSLGQGNPLSAHQQSSPHGQHPQQQQPQQQQQHQQQPQGSQQPQSLYGAPAQSSPMLSSQQPLPYGTGASPGFTSGPLPGVLQSNPLLTSPPPAYQVPPVQGNQFSLSPSKAAALASAAASGGPYGGMPLPMGPASSTHHMRPNPDRGLHSSPQMPAAAMGHSPLRSDRRPSQQPQAPMGAHHPQRTGALPPPGMIPDPRAHPLLESIPAAVEEAPLYVNAKQFHRIIKRRQAREKLDDALRQKGLSKRPTYLHESRHKHAMRRPRGPGGRFLTASEAAALKKSSGDEGGTRTAEGSDAVNPSSDNNNSNENGPKENGGGASHQSSAGPGETPQGNSTSAVSQIDNWTGEQGS